VTGDSGPATPNYSILGPFEGRVVAVDPLVGYTFKVMNIIPVNLNARGSTSSMSKPSYGKLDLRDDLVGLPPAVTAKD